MTLFKAMTGLKPFTARNKDNMYTLMTTKARNQICGFEDENGILDHSDMLPTNFSISYEANEGVKLLILDLLQVNIFTLYLKIEEEAMENIYIN